MRRLLLSLLLLVAGFFIAPASSENSERAGGQRRIVGTGYPAPDFALPDLNGQVVSLSDFHGSPVVLFTWATW